MLLMALAFWAVYFIGPLGAQEALFLKPEGEIVFQEERPPSIKPKKIDPSFGQKLSLAEQKKLDNENALRRLNDALVLSQEKKKKLSDEIATLDDDRDNLVDELIVTARSIQTIEDSLSNRERALTNLAEEELRLQKSLVSRRAILSEVLAALQRMGQNPPPALVVHSKDVLQSVRSAILLGSVLPELKLEGEALFQDLEGLRAIADATRLERDGFIDEQKQLSEEQLRLDLLIKENRKLRARSDDAVAKEQKTVSKISEQATNLRELVIALDQEISLISGEILKQEVEAEALAKVRLKAFEKERQKHIASLSNLSPAIRGESTRDTDESETNDVLAYLSPSENPQLEALSKRKLDYQDVLENQIFDPSLPFSQQKGQLIYPVTGKKITKFGGFDGLAGLSDGETVETRTKAPVLSPTSGKVVFAGKFPGFDQLLIISVGNGYHIVLAGMTKINVELGDIVKAGEPVAQMGGERRARLAGLSADLAATLKSDLSSGQAQPVLYIEFRRNGKPINPAPWWAKS